MPNRNSPMWEMYGGGETPADAGAESAPKDETQTALISSSICPGMEPGDELKLRVVAVHDKEYEVSYENDTDEKEEEIPGKMSRGPMSPYME